MEFEKKKVTVIMGIYNCQDTLEEAICLKTDNCWIIT